MCDLEAEVLAELLLELHGSERISTVAISNESEVLRELVPEVGYSLSHGEYTGSDTAILGTPVAKDGALESIHDEPDIAFLALDLDVGLISGEITGRLVIVVVYEGLDQHGGSLAVIGDLLVRDLYAVHIPHDVGCTPERDLVVDVVSEAHTDDLG